MKKNLLMIILIILLIVDMAFTGWVKWTTDKTAARLSSEQKAFATEIKNTLAVQDAMLNRLMHPGL